MRKIKLPLIISDFDGTLVRADGTIGEYTKNAIEKYIQDGGKFAVCTGRGPQSILQRTEELGLKGIVSCYQGAAIFDAESGKMLLDGTIPTERALPVVQEMERLGLHIHIYGKEDFYSNMDDKAFRDYEKVVRQKGKVEENLSRFMQETNFCPYKMMVMIPPTQKDKVFAHFSNLFGEEFYVTASADFLVEVCNKKYSKATGVQYIADYFGIAIEDAAAVGDQWNDMPMIECVGHGFAVKNAHESLKEHATVLAYTNEEDAVGHLIEDYGYEKE